MPRGPTIIGRITREYLRLYPKAPDQTLARLLMREHPEVFHTLNAARRSVRWHRGKSCSRPGVRCPNPIGVVSREFSEACRTSGFGLPLPEPSDFAFYDLKALFPNVRHWLILPDVHGQFYDLGAMETALSWAISRTYKFDGLLLLGDFIDCYAIAPFWKDPRRMSMADEAVFAGHLMRKIVEIVKPKKVVWKLGNHERRWQLEGMTRVKEMFEAAGLLEIQDLPAINFKEIGDLVVPDNCILTYEELNLAHGHELSRWASSAVNAARNAVLKTMECVCIAHHHRRSTHDEVTIRDRLVSAESLGCLCQLHPRWCPINKWQHGFGVLHTSPKWELENRKIVGGKVH